MKGQSRGSATFLLLFLSIVGLAESKLRRRIKDQVKTPSPMGHEDLSRNGGGVEIMFKSYPHQEILKGEISQYR